MGTICSTVAGWLQAGFNKAVGFFKCIWEKVCSLFSGLTNLARGLLERLGLGCSYNRERSYVQTQPGRVEVGHDKFRLSVGIDNETQAEPVSSNPDQPEPVSSNPDQPLNSSMDDKSLNALIKVGKFAEEMKKIKDTDEGHQNNAQTSRKLNDLYNSKAGQEMRNLLYNRPTVNPSLA